MTEETKSDNKDTNKQKESAFTWASVCHFSALLGVIWWIPLNDWWIPVGHMVAPLGVWIVKRKEDPLIDLAGRESLNFQLNVTTLVVLIALFFDNIVARSIIWLVVILDIYWVAKAGVTASYGRVYLYPLKMLRVFPIRRLLEDIGRSFD